MASSRPGSYFARRQFATDEDIGGVEHRLNLLLVTFGSHKLRSNRSVLVFKRISTDGQGRFIDPWFADVRDVETRTSQLEVRLLCGLALEFRPGIT